jgi:hypothetical protein
MMREWSIFALCLGAGGHIVLALVFHAPEAWPWQEAGTYGVFVGLSVYGVVQLIRFCWSLLRGRYHTEADV